MAARKNAPKVTTPKVRKVELIERTYVEIVVPDEANDGDWLLRPINEEVMRGDKYVDERTVKITAPCFTAVTLTKEVAEGLITALTRVVAAL